MLTLDPAIAIETTPVAVIDAPPPQPIRRWRLASRVAFRFCATYFFLYVASTQMLSALLPYVPVRPLAALPPLHGVVQWTALSVFGFPSPLVQFSGSGDKPFDWTLVAVLLVISAAVTTLWSVLDRRRPDYIRLQKWFHLFLRFALGATLVSYGMVKVFPLQMPAPGLTRLLEPFGHFSPMGVLWASIGASRSYEMFTGFAELTAGILLFIPRTATLGALAALVVTGEIFTLNMTYDVPVKLFSFQLVLMALFLLAPEARRLLNVLVLNRAAPPSSVPPLGRSRRAILIGVVAQIACGAVIVFNDFQGAKRAWDTRTAPASKSPLYGIWDVAYLSIDGVERAPLVTDYDRWRRVLFDGPTAAAFQRMDDTFTRYAARIDRDQKTITLTPLPPPGVPPPPSPAQQARAAGTFSFERPATDRLVLSGQLDGRKMHLELQLFDRTRLLLVTRGFNWVQDYPFNR